MTLGTLATQTLLKTTDPVVHLRGRVFDYHGASLVPTFHPAYLLRTPSAKRDTWQDMKVVMQLLGLVDPRKASTEVR